MSRLRTLLSLVLLGCCAPLAAGPYEVGGTSTAKRFKFKSNVQLSHAASKDSWVLPKIGIGGPVNDRLELSIGTGYGVIEESSGRDRAGMRDMSIGLKWRLRDESDRHAALTIEPSLTLPTGDEAAGTGKGAYALSLPVRMGRQFGKLRVTGQVSAARSFGQDADQLGGGGLLEYFGSPQWSCGVELVADAPRQDLQAYHLRANVGAKRKFGKHVELQALAGRTLQNRHGEAATTMKLVFEYRL